MYSITQYVFTYLPHAPYIQYVRTLQPHTYTMYIYSGYQFPYSLLHTLLDIYKVENTHLRELYVIHC